MDNILKVLKYPLVSIILAVLVACGADHVVNVSEPFEGASNIPDHGFTTATYHTLTAERVRMAQNQILHANASNGWVVVYRAAVFPGRGYGLIFEGAAAP